MKAVLHYRASPGFRRRLAEAAPDGLTIAVVDEADTDGFAREMADADVLLHVLEPVTEAHIAAAPALRLIQKIGVGVNTIDLAAAASRGIAVCNMPGTNSQAVAELSLALMLAALRRVEVDGVDADADLLDQAQRRRRGHVGLGHRLEYVKQHVGVRHLAGEAFGVGLVDDGDRKPVGRRLGEPAAEPGSGAVVEHRLHGSASAPA